MPCITSSVDTREDVREYADQSRAAVVAAGYQRLGRQHQQQQQQLARPPPAYPAPEERGGSRRLRRAPSRDRAGGGLAGSRGEHFFDGDDTDEGFYRSESPPRQPLNPNDELGRYLNESRRCCNCVWFPLYVL